MGGEPVDGCVFCDIGSTHGPLNYRKLKEGGFEYVKPDGSRTFLLLSTPHVLAFLDIMPVTHAHTLVVPREHYVKVTDMPADVAAEVGALLPLVSRAVMRTLGGTDFNIVQNNGPSAGQVVDHVHFHIIPRQSTTRPWTWLGKGGRVDIDEDDAEKLALEIRNYIHDEIKEKNNPVSSKLDTKL